MERAQRITAVLELPSGVVPKLTYLSVKTFSWIEKFVVKEGFKYASALASAYVLVATSGLEFASILRRLVAFLGL